MIRIRFDGYALGSALSAPSAGAPRFPGSLARRGGSERGARQAGRIAYPWLVVGLPLAALDNPIDLLMLLVVALLIFGKNLPDVARSLGKGIRELKESVNFDEVTSALSSVNEVRSAVSPNTIARAALPGVAEFQDTLGATKDLVNPLAEPTEAEAGEAGGAAGAEGADPGVPAAPAAAGEDSA